MIERGKIRNKEHIPIKDYSGLQYGKITPTDIDGFMDFGDRTFIFIELKHGKGAIPFGQKLALERLCDACESPERKAAVIVARYQNEGAEIDVAPLPVSEYRFLRTWHVPREAISVRQAIDVLLSRSIYRQLKQAVPGA